MGFEANPTTGLPGPNPITFQDLQGFIAQLTGAAIAGDQASGQTLNVLLGAVQAQLLVVIPQQLPAVLNFIQTTATLPELTIALRRLYDHPLFSPQLRVQGAAFAAGS